MSKVLAAVPKKKGEFWTARQRQMHSLHYAISYRASFKPELPDFLIRNYSRPGQLVGDPFCGRGTTILQANLLKRYAIANDINPLAVHITRAKVNPVSLEEIRSFLLSVEWDCEVENQESNLSFFYHPKTIRELLALKKSLASSDSNTARFISLLAISRLHGHSSGFFSVYSMPQLSVTPQAQQRINQQRNQKPEYRAVMPRLLTKAKAVLRDNQIEAIRSISAHNQYTSECADNLTGWPSSRVDLIITSPPFLNKVDYITDNWLEHWFLGICADEFKENMLQTASLAEWQLYMGQFMLEVKRVLKPGGICVIEVGDVLYKGEKLNLDDILVSILHTSPDLALEPKEILIHQQNFTKLAHCFSVTNNEKGTNTQRMLVIQKK